MRAPSCCIALAALFLAAIALCGSQARIETDAVHLREWTAVSGACRRFALAGGSRPEIYPAAS
jgi:hypothetical protein